MGSRWSMGCAAVMMAASTAWGGEPADRAPGAWTLEPLTLQQQWESVYAPPTFPAFEEGVNAGGVHIDLTVRYMTDYVFRGIERFDADIDPEDAANIQFDGTLSFDLGKFPHPFIGVFVNVAESDEISNFQEIRPYFGVEWTARPLTFTFGHNTYIFLDRGELDTSEVFVRLTLDDSYFLRTDEPLLSPYIYAAYDYDLYHGWYIEAGVEHDFRVGDTGLVLTAQASAAYVRSMPLFAGPRGRESGFQHYQVGVIGSYSLNTLLNVSRRYGDWSIKGYLFYTDRLDTALRADRGLWGGAGIGFRY